MIELTKGKNTQEIQVPPVPPMSTDGSRQRTGGRAGMPRDYSYYVKKYLRDLDKIMANRGVTAMQQANLICKLTQEQYINTGHLTREDLYRLIGEDNNLFSVTTILQMIQTGLLAEEELYGQSGINTDFLLALDELKPHNDIITSPAPLDKVKIESTEVYFWGLPSSGKSCLIGGALSRLYANDYKIMTVPECNGYEYLNIMRSSFSSPDVISLPPGTPLSDCYEMGFIASDKKGKKHPITVIDLAGEMLRTMYVAQTAEASLNASQKKALTTVENLLSKNVSKNHKIHFFVVEYGAEKLKYQGLDHLTYFDSTINYLNKMGVFNRLTDAIYIVISKADKAPYAYDVDRIEKFRDYFNKYFSQLRNTVELVCEDNHITKTGSMVFTLGEVCFQNFCKVTPEPSDFIVEKIMNLTGTKWFGFLGKSLDW